MNFKKVLYATDFSSGSQAALPFATAFASTSTSASTSEAGATLLIVHVDDTTPGLVFGDVGYGYVPQVDEIAQQEYQHLLTIVPDSDKVRYEHRFLRGSAADGILGVADREQVDLIVIGTHGRSGLGRLLMGSVAEAVVRRAKCPVLTIKQPVEHSKTPSPSKQKVSQS